MAAMLVGQPVTSSAAALYVGDLEPTVTEAQLYELFTQETPVASVRVCRNSADRRSLGYAYVNFGSVDDALQALEKLNYTELNGKAIRIMWSHRDSTARKSGIGNLFVKNLHESIDNKNLHQIFSPYGKILSCKVAMQDGKSRGHGFVSFEREEDAIAAIEQLNGMTIEDKKVFVGKFVKRSERMLSGADLKYTNLYVKNIDYDITENELEEKFSEFGKITNLIIMRDENDRPKGFGFVNFDNPEDAKRAVDAMNGAQLGSKILFVGRAQKRAEREQLLRREYEEKRLEWIQKFQGSNIYVKNLTDAVDEDTLRSHFSSYGTIMSAKVMRNEKGISKGFGFVCFSSPEEATKAVDESHGFMMFGKPIYVAIAQRKEVRRAQLEQHYAQQVMGPMVPAPMPPLYYATPPGLISTMPQRQGMMYPVGVRPGWRPPLPVGRPGFQPMPILPMVPPGPRQRQQMRNLANGPPQVGSVPMGLLQSQPQRTRQAQKQPSNGWGREQEVSMVNQQAAPGGLATGQADLGEWSSVLAKASPQQQKQMLGERLYPLVQKRQLPLAGKITGMLLEMDNNELLFLLDSEDALASKVEEAEIVLLQHSKSAQEG
ncbi:hypothetical protein GOP47_0007396 [Adiantum capillus-veneris]|uniref:Polyadenylate-binding protein n=1 Tax=Adiantum capillus-veneris TaxID=13818 RepID=A0A9D4ZKW1_ADICA|nr:hypothetical protein GOP47_0007396 [Adiantum capillus-veneris]